MTDQKPTTKADIPPQALAFAKENELAFYAAFALATHSATHDILAILLHAYAQSEYQRGFNDGVQTIQDDNYDGYYQE